MPEETIATILAEARREERHEETVDEALAALYRESRDFAERVDRAVRGERTRMRIELNKLVRVAHNCYECARFRTERCHEKGNKPDSFQIACGSFEKVWHKLTAEEESLCELQAHEINWLQQENVRLKIENERIKKELSR